MKKAMIFVIMTIVSFSIFAVTDPPVSHMLVGYVDLTLNFSLDIKNEVLPFDLDGADVFYNSSYVEGDEGIINGIKIASYTLISNDYNFRLFITHDKLKLTTELSQTSTNSNSIDYRLYAVIDDEQNVFMSTLSDQNADSPLNAVNRILLEGVYTNKYSFVNKSLYVSLDAGGLDSTRQVLDSLKPGLYESYIYIYLQGGR